MIQSVYVKPTPEWCIKNALETKASFAHEHLVRAIAQGAGEVWSNPFTSDWNGMDFWRCIRINGDTAEVEFNENYIERFTNPDWRWHTVKLP